MNYFEIIVEIFFEFLDLLFGSLENRFVWVWDNFFVLIWLLIIFSNIDLFFRYILYFLKNRYIVDILRMVESRVKLNKFLKRKVKKYINVGFKII